MQEDVRQQMTKEMLNILGDIQRRDLSFRSPVAQRLSSRIQADLILSYAKKLEHQLGDQTIKRLQELSQKGWVSCLS